MENYTAELAELVKKIEELELELAHLKQKKYELLISSPANQITNVDRHQKQKSHFQHSLGEGVGSAGVGFTNEHCMNILESMGQALHVLDGNNRITFWNRMAENLFGYSRAEALGKDVMELLADPLVTATAETVYKILQGVMMGESWTGLYPAANRRGDRLSILATTTPLYDDDGTIVGAVCVSVDAQPFEEAKSLISARRDYGKDPNLSRAGSTASAKLGLDPQQPLQVAVAFKISDLASKVSNKVMSKMRPAWSYSDLVYSDAFEGGIHNYCSPGKPSRDPSDKSEGKPVISKILSTKAASWIEKKGLVWPWKGNKRDTMDPNSSRFVWPWIHNDQEYELGQQQSDPAIKSENQVNETNRTANNEPSGSSPPSVNVNSSSSVINKVDADLDSSDLILWEDLTIGDKIGEGACGTVYRALLYGSHVAVKLYSKQECSDDLILSFKQEVSIMKRLRHPNILLFMGANTSHQRLCIVTEFLPRGSIFQLLQRNSSKLEWRRRIHMAMDIAQGMNYLHHCSPPIVHRDLKSSNLLVDRNWTVKVGDFGLSRLKHATFLTTSEKGTPQWMAPEVLRNEPSNEKADVYSYGVVLWELVTLKIPWENLNTMEVFAAVGFMNQRLEIPKDVDPLWIPIIESCWHSDPQCRPSFLEIMGRLKDLQRHYIIQSKAERAVRGDAPSE